jgi:hypothetical protein
MSVARVPSPGVGCAGSFTLFRLPSDLGDLAALRQLAGKVGGAFRSRLVAAGFARGLAAPKGFPPSAGDLGHAAIITLCRQAAQVSCVPVGWTPSRTASVPLASSRA